MNAIVLLITIGIAIKSAVSDVATNRTKFDSFLYERCKKYSSDAVAYDNIKDHLDQFTDFVKLSFSKLPKEKDAFCSEKMQLIELMRQVAKDMRPCLPKDEKYLPGFMFDSFGEFLNFLCRNGGSNINNYFSTTGQECISNLKISGAGEEAGHCFRKIIAPFDGVVKKDRLCDDLKTAKKCFKTAITKHCSNFLAFETLNDQFWEAIRKPCNSASALGISSLILLVTLFMQKVFS